MEINKIRKEYQERPLRKSDLHRNPIIQFQSWLHEAIEAKVIEPNALILATANKEGRPSSRTVLLKHLDTHGFVFFTNYQSRKGRELDENPYASMTFLWKELERQVSIEGKVIKTSSDESAAYFALRPRGSQLGAWASQQGSPIKTREDLENEYRRLEKMYEGKTIPAPPHWGGFRLIPARLEFWQGRANRLHDRFTYTLEKEVWSITRLAP